MPRLLALVACVFAFTACGSALPPPASDSQDASAASATVDATSTDTTPPTANVDSATPAQMAGTVNIVADAEDNIGVTDVEFYLDGVLLGRSATSPYTFSWDSTSTNNGQHAIYVVAHDAEGNAGTSPQFLAQVANDVYTQPLGAGISVHTSLGLPNNASSNNIDDYLSVKSQYVIAYDSARKEPTWVSWELNAAYLGAQDRSNDFRPDDTLPGDVLQAKNTDYDSSGYDRGHMCPSADRTANKIDNEDTFYLSNVMPQAANNNRGPWATLETYERTLAKAGKELFIVAGGVYGTKTNTISADNIAVPSATFKVIVVLDTVADRAPQVSTATRVIAIEIPNDDSEVTQKGSWTSYIVSARQVERDTGLNFNSDLPQDVQDVIEAEVDSGS